MSIVVLAFTRDGASVFLTSDGVESFGSPSDEDASLRPASDREEEEMERKSQPSTESANATHDVCVAYHISHARVSRWCLLLSYLYRLSLYRFVYHLGLKEMIDWYF